LHSSAATLHASAISRLICITTASMLRLTTMSRLQSRCCTSADTLTGTAFLDRGRRAWRRAGDQCRRVGSPGEIRREIAEACSKAADENGEPSLDEQD